MIKEPKPVALHQLTTTLQLTKMQKKWMDIPLHPTDGGKLQRLAASPLLLHFLSCSQTNWVPH